MSNIKKLLIYKILGVIKNSGLIFLKSCNRQIRMVVKEHYWENKLGIDTAGVVQATDDLSLCKDAVIYASTQYGVLEKVIDYLNLNADDIFVDLGCGKGRVLFFVATQRLRKVVGVELRKELVDIARSNLNNLRLNNTPVEIINADASSFDIKEGSVFFMFNPFGEKTLTNVVANIKKSLIDNPRKIRIVYFNPEYREVLDSQDWLSYGGGIENTATHVWYNKS